MADQTNDYLGELDVIGTITGGSTAGKLLDTVVDPEFRTVGFREIQAPTEEGQTWVIVHGWNSSPDADNIAELIQATKDQANPGDRILALDWREAANNTGGFLRAGGNGIAATWISDTAEFAVNALVEEYGLDPVTAGQSLNLVGHSLGSLVSSEIGQIYKTGVNRGSEVIVVGNDVGTRTITALDPAAETNLVPDFLSDQSGYDVDGSLSGRQSPADFDDSSVFSRAYIGKRSIAGNPLFADSADEAYELDFGNWVDFGGEHTRVVQFYSNILARPSEIGELLGYDSYQSLDGLTIEEFDEIDVTRRLRSRTYQGIIDVDDANQPTQLTANSSVNDNGKIIIGEYQADVIDGGAGNDKLFGDSNNDTLTGKSGNDLLVGGEGNDRLSGDGLSNTGDDIIYGGSGADTLSGEGGTDTFVFQPGDGSSDRSQANLITDFKIGVDIIGLKEINSDALSFEGDSIDSTIRLGEEYLAVLEGVSLDEINIASQNSSFFSSVDTATFEIV